MFVLVRLPLTQIGGEARQRTVEALKRQLNEDEEGEEGELDSDDETDLSQRLAGVDLEDSQAVWQGCSLTAFLFSSHMYASQSYRAT